MAKNFRKLMAAALLISALPMMSAASDVEFPLVQSFSYFPYLNHSVLTYGDHEFILDLGYSNIYMFNYKRDVISDFEMGRATLGFRYAAFKNLNVEFYLRTGFLTGGIMDKLIEDFHKLTGIKNDARDQFPRNTVTYRYKDVFLYNDSMMFAGPLIAGILTRLYDGGRFGINFRASIGIPLQEKAGISTGNPFLTTGMIFQYSKNRFAADLSLYASFYKIPDNFDPDEVRSRMFQFNLQMSWNKMLGGVLFRSTPFRDGDLSNPAYQLYIGYKLSDSIKIMMVEEIPPMDTVPDVAFHLIVEFR